MDLSSVSIFEATSEQNEISRRRNYTEWARGLSLAEYLRRDQIVDTHEHATNGKLRTWVLAPVDNPKTLDFFCACETFEREAIVQNTTTTAPKKVVAYGISSVFCPLENRNKGYTTRMMHLLHYVLAPVDVLGVFPEKWGSLPVRPSGIRDAAFSMLWSAIGGDFYSNAGWGLANSGWKLKKHVNTVWKCRDMSELLNSGHHAYDIRWLSESDCIHLWEEDAQFIEKSLWNVGRLEYKNEIKNTTCCAFLSNGGLAAFQIRRARMYLPGSPHLPIPVHWGVEVSYAHPGETEKAYITWVVDMNHGPASLAVTRLRATEKSLPILLAAAMEGAKQNKCESVEVCDLDPSLRGVAKDLGGDDSESFGCSPSLAWYGPERAEDVNFLFNERYCYC